uniref:Uncharacterized protein n=1 Tax=Anguilla anguilla TaxID=7936 RepID=A0A0E9WVK3_ANGAN
MAKGLLRLVHTGTVSLAQGWATCARFCFDPISLAKELTDCLHQHWFTRGSDHRKTFHTGTQEHYSAVIHALIKKRS